MGIEVEVGQHYTDCGIKDIRGLRTNKDEVVFDC